jgi:hypothetical protein
MQYRMRYRIFCIDRMQYRICRMRYRITLHPALINKKFVPVVLLELPQERAI